MGWNISRRSGLHFRTSLMNDHCCERMRLCSLDKFISCGFFHNIKHCLSLCLWSPLALLARASIMEMSWPRKSIESLTASENLTQPRQQSFAFIPHSMHEFTCRPATTTSRNGEGTDTQSVLLLRRRFGRQKPSSSAPLSDFMRNDFRITLAVERFTSTRANHRQSS